MALEAEAEAEAEEAPMTTIEYQLNVVNGFVHSVRGLGESRRTLGVLLLGGEPDPGEDSAVVESTRSFIRGLDVSEASWSFPKFVTLEEMLQSHKALFPTWELAGKFRTTEAAVVQRNGGEVWCCSSYDLQARVEALIDSTNDTLRRIYQRKEVSVRDLVRVVALFLKRFEEIHPFSDGNGRVGRILAAGLLRLVTPFGPCFLGDSSKDDFYACFEPGHSVDELEDLFLRGIRGGWHGLTELASSEEAFSERGGWNLDLSTVLRDAQRARVMFDGTGRIRVVFGERRWTFLVRLDKQLAYALVTSSTVARLLRESHEEENPFISLHEARRWIAEVALGMKVEWKSVEVARLVGSFNGKLDEILWGDRAKKTTEVASLVERFEEELKQLRPFSVVERSEDELLRPFAVVTINDAFMHLLAWHLREKLGL